RSGTGAAKSAAGIENALISVVEEKNVKRTRRGRADEVGVVLGGKPVDGIDGVGSSRLKRKIALIAELPQDAAIAGAVVVVDLDDPVLVTDRKQQGFVIRRIGEGVAMSPVGKLHGTAVGVEVIEGIPEPDRFAIFVEVYDRVPNHIGSGDIL